MTNATDATRDRGAVTRDYGIAPPGYRLPDATRLGSVTLQVAALTRSLDYYERVLGLRVLERTASTAVLSPHGDPTPLVMLRERLGAAPVPRRGRLGLYHFAILLPDRAALGRFVSHLAALGEYAGSSDHLVSEALYLTDPDGLGIEVYRDRPRETWPVEARELVMAVDPLDVRGVVEAARGEPWTGMPAGTVMGHVHLHVGSLEEASTFYHEGLGFDKTAWHFPGALFLSAGGYHHHLGTNTWAEGARPAGEADARLLEWEIVVPTEGDARAALGSVARVDSGFRRNDGPPRHPGESRDPNEVVRDPWGTAVRVRAAGAQRADS